MAKLPANRRKTYFTPQQLHAIELLSEPGKIKYSAVADQVGVSRRLLYDWRQNEEFLEEVKKRATQKVGEFTSSVYARLMKEIEEKGSAKHIELFLKTQGLLQPEVQMNQLQINSNERPSNEEIEADISRVLRELEDIDENYAERRKKWESARRKRRAIDIDPVDEDEE